MQILDKAIAGACRCGYVRAGVTKPLFDEAVEKLEKTPVEDSAYFDVAHFDSSRYDEKDSSMFKKAVKAVENP